MIWKLRNVLAPSYNTFKLFSPLYLIHQFHHSNALWLVWVILAGECVRVGDDPNRSQQVSNL
jgi:hypothetical protein